MDEFSRATDIASLADDKRFEHFSAYCIVSSRHQEDFDTSDLVVGAGADLNVDSFAVLVNGRLAADADFVSDILEINGYLDVEFIIIQSKTTSAFDAAAIIALGDNLEKEIFSNTLSLPANADVKRLIEISQRIYSHAPKLKNNPTCRVYYVTTGNWTDDPYLSTVINRKKDELLGTNLFSEVFFEPVGARAIQDFYRETKKSISREIKFKEHVTLPEITGVRASYLGVLPATEFIKLITDNDGNIVKSVFVDNVRDFQGENDVNRDIAETIQQGLFDQFALRNNGITVVAKEVKQTSSSFTLLDYQIVNGCQTSHVIFTHKNSLTDDLLIPFKLIYTSSEDVTQSIIKSTNKQTPVDENDLLALTKFQRDLEDYYAGMTEEMRLYYERRGKQYANRSDIERGRITSIGSQLKSFASMFLDQPHQAGRYQGTLLKTVKDQVFRENHRPEAYYCSALASYRFEKLIKALAVEDRAIRPFRYYLLTALRHRYETSAFPGAGSKKIATYCEILNAILGDSLKTKASFDECRSIVVDSLNNLGLPFERDSAKLRPLVDEIRRVAIARREEATSSLAAKESVPSP